MFEAAAPVSVHSQFSRFLILHTALENCVIPRKLMVWGTLHKHQIEVFVITFMCVLSLHAARESWYMVRAR